MRHRGAPLLLLAERLERFSDLGPLEVTDLDRDPLQRPGGDRERRHEAGVAVARHDLGRNFIDLQTKLAADMLLDPRVDGGVRSHRTAHAADGGFVGRAPEATDRAIELRHPTRDLEAERGGLGDDTVGATRHQSLAMPDRQLRRRFARRCVRTIAA